MIHLKAEQVSPYLPNYLELAPQTVTAAGEHPVILIFANHVDARLFGSPAGSGINYNEYLTYIPFVRLKGQSTIFNYLARVYLDNLNPTYFGLREYGYLKDFSKMENAHGRFSAADALTGGLILRAEAVPVFQRKPFKDAWKTIAEIFARPMVSDLNGNILCATFQFEHHVNGPKLIKVYTENGIPGLGPEFKGRVIKEGSMDSKKLVGAFYYESNYSLSPPLPVSACQN